jgi:hypothetical protein
MQGVVGGEGGQVGRVGKKLITILVFQGACKKWPSCVGSLMNFQ